MTKTAAIIGGGVIGGGWAARFLLNGWDVRLFDPDPESERKISEVLANARASLPMLYDRKMPPEGKLSTVDTVAGAVDGAVYIQESVPERLEIKHSVFREILGNADENSVICSSTSGFKPSELIDGLDNASRILVAHPFNPVYLLPVVEIVGAPHTDPLAKNLASDILASIGMYPVKIAKEIDAHVADRLLEAVWREALWLIKDGITTTEQLDNIMRYGFGLRWAQMGLFETYRVAGGEAGMKHFMAQFGPALKWPWTKLMDVPEFTDELVDLIAGQSDEQSGHMSIRELERLRDGNLVAMMRALKGRDSAVGALLNAHETKIPSPKMDITKPLTTVSRIIPSDWTDYNGHMNESRYGQVFSDAADAVMIAIGADEEYIAAGNSYFTVDIHIKFIEETHAGCPVIVTSLVKEGQGKKLRLYHELRHEDGRLLATGEQLLLHVSLETRRTSEPLPKVGEKLVMLAAAHAPLLESS